MLKKYFSVILSLVTIFFVISCSSRMGEEQYVDWLYQSMPLPDSLTYSREYWQQNVTKTLEVRERMGWNVPEREFRHFVLPLRVNNESLDDFRTLYADTLCARVSGLSIGEAALEINHWCHEQAIYRPSDARTSSPTATIRRGFGRCGEESVLTVAALRAAGIPARQVYTPRWAHTDDNHAWVEVYVDGKWYYMGACEPEPRLNMGWFDAPVSRVMLLHTNVFGDYHGKEDVIRRAGRITEINVTPGYVQTRRTEVRVVDESGKAVEGAKVEFKIYNYAEFYTVASYTTPSGGKVALNTGDGDLLVWASKADRFGYAVAGGTHTDVVLSHTFGESFGEDIEIHPPVENPLHTGVTDKEIEHNRERLATEDAIRESHDHHNPVWDTYDGPEALAGLLNAKDRGDITAEVLDDALLSGAHPYVLDPRVELEALLPFRGEVLASGISDRLLTAEDVACWTRDSIRVVEDRNPQNLRIPPISVWRSRLSDRLSRRIFFVALCRACGIPSRMDPVTGKTQYLPGPSAQWVDIDLDGEAPAEEPSSQQGSVCLNYSGGPVSEPLYYRHFTLAKVEEGRERLLEFGSDADETPLSLLGPAENGATVVCLDPGYYVLTTGSRLSDGSVLARLEFFSVGSGRPVVPLILRSETPQGILPDDAFLLAIMGDKDEPTSHARLELEAAAGFINEWGGKVIIVGKALPSGLDNLVTETDFNLDAVLPGKLPVIAVCDPSGKVYYRSEGYNTSLSSDLRNVLR